MYESISELGWILFGELSSLNEVGLVVFSENSARAISKKVSGEVKEGLPKLLSFYKENKLELDDIIGDYMMGRMKRVIIDSGEDGLANLFMDTKALNKEVYDFVIAGEKIAREGNYTLKAVKDAFDDYLTDF